MPLSDDERRAKNAEKNRRYRARKAAERDAARGVVSGHAAVTVAPSVMRDAVSSAIGHMKWLVPSDDASVAQAKMLAEDIDLFRHAGEHTKALSAQAKLSRVLNDLGGTPSVRLARELRSLKAGPRTEGDDDATTSDGSLPGNVTKLKRPPKRRA